MRGELNPNGKYEENVAIEEIVVNDWVYSKDEETGVEVYKPVTELFRNNMRYLRDFRFSDNTGVMTTWNHPFYIANKGWTEVKDIQVGERVVTANGEIVTIDDISYEVGKTKVYNFEVEDNHTYFVGDAGVLVHNDNKCNIQNPYNPKKKGTIMGFETDLVESVTCPRFRYQV